MNTVPKPDEQDILRDLADQVSEIAVLPIQHERIRLWMAMNSLNPERPLAAIYPERAWDELIPESELHCEDPLLRIWELSLRRTIFHHEYIHDDRPLHGRLLIPWVIDWGTIGLETKTVHVRSDGPEAVRWEPPIRSMRDVERLRFRKITIDREETSRRIELAESIFGGILPVTVYGGVPFWSVGLSQLMQLRGLEQTMVDMYEEPEITHAIMSFLRDDRIRVMDILEAEGVLSVNHLSPIEYFIGSGHEGYCNELPVEDFDGRVRWNDMWGLGEMQEFSGVGPAQFDEFSLQYQVPLLERFGLVNYGCCEPLDKMYGMLMKRIPRLRRVSVTSPYADKETAADMLGNRVIYAWKPNPTALAMPEVDWAWVENDMRETIEIASGCCLEIIMKSTETFAHDPSRLRKWVDTAYRCIEEQAYVV